MDLNEISDLIKNREEVISLQESLSKYFSEEAGGDLQVSIFSKIEIVREQRDGLVQTPFGSQKMPVTITLPEYVGFQMKVNYELQYRIASLLKDSLDNDLKLIDEKLNKHITI